MTAIRGFVAVAHLLSYLLLRADLLHLFSW